MTTTYRPVKGKITSITKYPDGGKSYNYRMDNGDSGNTSSVFGHPMTFIKKDL